MLTIEYCQISTSKGIVRGTIHHNGKKNNYSDMILIIHGYLSSNRIGPNRLYYLIAKHLSNNFESCIARFDCLGMGESDCDIETLCFNDFIQIHRELVINLSLQYGLKNIYIIGHCLGANVASYLAKDINNVRGLILVAPSTTDDESLNKFFTKNGQVEELLKIGHTKRKGLFVDVSFFSGDNERNALFNTISKLNCNIVLIECEKDDFYSLTKPNEIPHNCTYYCINDADHNFIEPTVRNELINIITSELIRIKKKNEN